jgi:hypothetical protein
MAALFTRPFTAAIYAARDAATEAVKAPVKKGNGRSTAIAEFVPRETRQRTATTNSDL